MIAFRECIQALQRILQKRILYCLFRQHTFLFRPGVPGDAAPQEVFQMSYVIRCLHVFY